MKVDSITIETPLVFRGSVVNHSGQKIVATHLESFMRDRCAFYFGDESVNKVYLIILDYNNEPFVLQKTRKLKGLQKVAEDLAIALEANVSVIEVTKTDSDYKTHPVYVIDHSHRLDIQSITFQPENSGTDYTAVNVHRYSKDNFDRYDEFNKDLKSYSKYMPFIDYNGMQFVFTHYDNEEECEKSAAALEKLLGTEVGILTRYTGCAI